MTHNLPFKSTRTTFSGINIQGSATISQDAYVSGSLNAVTVGSFPLGEGLNLSSGTISSTIAGGSASIYAGNNIQVGGSTVSVVENPVFQQITASTINMTGFPVFDTDVITGFVFQLHGTQVMGIANNVNYNDLGGILSIGTLNAVRINAPAIPIGSGLAEASGTIYATGGASSGTVSAYEVLSPSNTLTLDVTTSTISASVVSSTLSIVNNTTTDSTAPFQQYIPINFSSGNLASQANGTLTNIQFSDISGSTIIPSWRESGTVNSGTAIYWLKLEQGISASSTLYVKMNFFTDKNSVLNDTDTGLAPDLPVVYGGTYATHDIGSIIFEQGSYSGYYNNFAGTVLGGGFYPYGGYDGSVNDGLTLTSSGNWGGILTDLTSTLPSIIIEGIVDQVTKQSFTFELSTSTVPLTSGDPPSNGYFYSIGPNSATLAIQYFTSSSGITLNTVAYSYQGSKTLGVGWSGTQLSMYVNYATILETQSASLSSYSHLFAGDFSGGNYNVQYVRARQYPPGSAMPSVQNTSIAPPEQAVVVFPTDATFINGPTSNEYATLLGKPFVTMSPYGTVNNSTITSKNNGADFGPDSTSGGTLTNTSGIQEFIGYCFANGGGHAIMAPGPYNLTGGLVSGTASGNAQVLIPYNYPGNPQIHITLEGETTPDYSIYQAQAGSPVITPYSTVNSAIIVSTISGSGLSPTVIGADGEPTGSGLSVQQYLLSNVHLVMKNVVVRTRANPNLKGIDTRNIAGYSLDTVGIEAGVSSSGNVTIPTNQTGIAFQGGGTGGASSTLAATGYNDGYQEIKGLYIQGFYYGAITSEHTNANGVFAQYCNVCIAPIGGGNGTHDSWFGYVDTEDSYFSVSDELMSGTMYMQLSKLDVQQGGGFSTLTILKNVTGYLSGEMFLGNSHSAQGETKLYSDSALLFPSKFSILNITNYPEITINSSTIVLDTTYQNKQPFKTQFSAPITYNNTSSAAATVQAFVGPSTSLDPLPYEMEPAGATAGRVRNLVFDVPAGWYYSIHGVNVSVGTIAIAPL